MPKAAEIKEVSPTTDTVTTPTDPILRVTITTTDAALAMAKAYTFQLGNELGVNKYYIAFGKAMFLPTSVVEYLESVEYTSINSIGTVDFQSIDTIIDATQSSRGKVPKFIVLRMPPMNEAEVDELIEHLST